MVRLLALCLVTLVVSALVPGIEAGASTASASGWVLTGSLSQGSQGGRAVLLNDGRVFYTGGFTSTGAGLSQTHLYDPSLQTWSAGPNLLNGRGHHTETLLLNGSVLMAGGGFAGNASELFDPVSGTITPAGTMHTTHMRHGAALLDDGRVLAAGGYQGCMTSTAELFNPATASWSLAGSMLRARADFNLVKLTDGRVLAAGGDNDCAFPRKHVAAEVFNPATNSWSPVASMNVPRAHYASTLLSDGRVIVIGGDNDPSGNLASAEIYDPAINTWTMAGSMSAPRFFPIGEGAVTLSDGRVLVAGADLVNPSTSEIFDPAIGIWAPPIEMNDGHCGGVLVKLADQTPLAISGASCSSPVPVLTAEYFVEHMIALPTGGALVREYTCAEAEPDQSVSIKKCHEGLDIAMPGAEVYAVLPGVVVEARCDDRDGYGWRVVIDHGDRGDGIRLFSLYAHMGLGDGVKATKKFECDDSRSFVSVREGDPVSLGQRLGLQGNSGNAYSEGSGDGTHLHFQMTLSSAFAPLVGLFDPTYCIGSPPYGEGTGAEARLVPNLNCR